MSGDCYCIQCEGPHREPEDCGWELCANCEGRGQEGDGEGWQVCGPCNGGGYIPGPNVDKEVRERFEKQRRSV